MGQTLGRIKCFAYTISLSNHKNSASISLQARQLPTVAQHVTVRAMRDPRPAWLQGPGSQHGIAKNRPRLGEAHSLQLSLSGAPG